MLGEKCTNPLGVMATLSPNETALVEVLSVAGYMTATFGRRHLGDIDESENLKKGF